MSVPRLTPWLIFISWSFFLRLDSNFLISISYTYPQHRSPSLIGNHNLRLHIDIMSSADKSIGDRTAELQTTSTTLSKDVAHDEAARKKLMAIGSGLLAQNEHPEETVWRILMQVSHLRLYKKRASSRCPDTCCPP